MFVINCPFHPLIPFGGRWLPDWVYEFIPQYKFEGPFYNITHFAPLGEIQSGFVSRSPVRLSAEGEPSTWIKYRPLKYSRWWSLQCIDVAMGVFWVGLVALLGVPFHSSRGGVMQMQKSERFLVFISGLRAHYNCNCVGIRNCDTHTKRGNALSLGTFKGGRRRSCAKLSINLVFEESSPRWPCLKGINCMTKTNPHLETAGQYSCFSGRWLQE